MERELKDQHNEAAAQIRNQSRCEKSACGDGVIGQDHQAISNHIGGKTGGCDKSGRKKSASEQKKDSTRKDDCAYRKQKSGSTRQTAALEQNAQTRSANAADHRRCQSQQGERFHSCSAQKPCKIAERVHKQKTGEKAEPFQNTKQKRPFFLVHDAAPPFCAACARTTKMSSSPAAAGSASGSSTYRRTGIPASVLSRAKRRIASSR